MCLRIQFCMHFWVKTLNFLKKGKKTFQPFVQCCNYFLISQTFKGSRQWESMGVWNVSNCPNLAQTAAIEVRFSLNFAIIFDFMYFRFRPSKAKWIGDVLTNRQNAAKYLQRFFIWSYFVYLPKCCGSGSPSQHCPPLHIWIAASILKTERYSLRHYTDATTHLAPLGNAQQYCSVFNFHLLFRGLFYSSPRVA